MAVTVTAAAALACAPGTALASSAASARAAATRAAVPSAFARAAVCPAGAVVAVVVVAVAVDSVLGVVKERDRALAPRNAVRLDIVQPRSHLRHDRVIVVLPPGAALSPPAIAHPVRAVEGGKSAQCIWCLVAELPKGLREIQALGDARERRRQLFPGRGCVSRVQCEYQHPGRALHADRMCVPVSPRREHRHERSLLERSPLPSPLARLRLRCQLAYRLA